MTNDVLLPAGRKQIPGRTQRKSRARRQVVDQDSQVILDNIRRYMSEKRLTVKEVARAARMDRNMVYQYLQPVRNGLGPLRITTIRRFSRGLGIPISQLLDRLRD